MSEQSQNPGNPLAFPELTHASMVDELLELAPPEVCINLLQAAAAEAGESSAVAMQRRSIDRLHQQDPIRGSNKPSPKDPSNATFVVLRKALGWAAPGADEAGQALRSQLPNSPSPDAVGKVSPPALAIAVRTGSFLVLADLAVAQIRCGLRQLDGQADGATSRELPMSDADQAAMQAALGEARQAIVAQSSASEIQSDASSWAAGQQQAGGASSSAGSSQAGSGQRQAAASASSSSSSTVRLVQGQSTGILALQASASGLVGGATGPGMDGGRSAALQARQEAAMDPGRARAFVTPADKERIRSRKSLSLAVCSLEILARAMRGLLGASSLNGPPAANPDPLAGPLPGVDGGGGGDEREMDRIIGAAQLEGAPLVPEATPAHLSAVARLVLALALLMRVGAGHGPQATVSTLNAAMARHASGGEREGGSRGSPASGSGSGAVRWEAPRCGLRPDAVASAGAAVAGLAASVQVAVMRAARRASQEEDRFARGVGGGASVQELQAGLGALGEAVRQLELAFEAAFRATGPSGASASGSGGSGAASGTPAPLCLDPDADVSRREARGVLRGAGAALQRLALTVAVHAGGAESAGRLVQNVRTQVEAVRPGRPIPGDVVSMLARVPEALGSAPAAALGGALMSTANLLSFAAFRGIVLGNPNWDAAIGGAVGAGGSGGGSAEDAAPDIGALLRAASEAGGALERRASVQQAKAKTKERLEAFGVGEGQGASPLALGSDDAGASGGMTSANFRLFALDVWARVLQHPRVGTRVTQGTMDFCVSQLLFHLPLMLARMSPDIARSHGHARPPAAPTVGEKATLAGIAARCLHVLNLTLAASPAPLARDAVAQSSQLEFALQACLGFKDQAMSRGADPADSGRWTDAQAALSRLRVGALLLLERAVFGAFRDWTAHPSYPAIRCGSLLRSVHVIRALLSLRQDAASLSFSEGMATLRTAAAGRREMQSARDANLERVAHLLQAAVGAFGPPLDERWMALWAPRLPGSSGLPPLLAQAPLPNLPGRTAELRQGPLGAARPGDFLDVALCRGKELAASSSGWVVIAPEVKTGMVQSASMHTIHPQAAEAAKKGAWVASGRLGPLHTFAPTFGPLRPAFEGIPEAKDPSMSPLRGFGHVLLRRSEAECFGLVPGSSSGGRAPSWGQPGDSKQGTLPRARQPCLWAGRYRAVQRGRAAPMPPRGFPGAYGPQGSPGPELVVPPLASPMGMTKVGTLDMVPPVTVYRPVAPPGYVSLGCVVSAGSEERQPPLDSVWCVHEQLVERDRDARPAGLLVPWRPVEGAPVPQAGEGDAQDDRAALQVGSCGARPFEIGGFRPHRLRVGQEHRLLRVGQSQFVLWQLLFDMHRSVGLHGVPQAKQAAEGAMAYRGQDLLTLTLCLRRIRVLQSELAHAYSGPTTAYRIDADSADSFLVLWRMGRTVIRQGGWERKFPKAWAGRPLDPETAQCCAEALIEEVRRSRDRDMAVPGEDLALCAMGLAGAWWGVQEVRDTATEVLAVLHEQGALWSVGGAMPLLRAAEAMHEDIARCPVRHRLVENQGGVDVAEEAGCCVAS